MAWLLMTFLLTLLGIILNALVLQDIFRTLFVPTGTGPISTHVARVVWRTFNRVQRYQPSAFVLAGPLMMLLIIALWAVGLALAWALMIWPHLPAGFNFAPGMDPAGHGDFGDAFYLSLVTLSTLGYGDIVPEVTWLRVFIPFEALVGFSLGTASVSWILSIYPVLARRRHLARQVFLLVRSEQRGALRFDNGDPALMGPLIMSLTEQVISMRNDLAQVPIIYYFHTPDRGSAVEVALLDLHALVDLFRRHPAPLIREYSVMLEEALMDLATHIAETFLAGMSGGLEEILHAYAADHAHPIDRENRKAEVEADLHAER